MIGDADLCDNDGCCEDYVCHEGHHLPHRRKHQPWDCPNLSIAERVAEIGWLAECNARRAERGVGPVWIPDKR